MVDRMEAYARLVALKYVYPEFDESALDFRFYIPAKHITAEVSMILKDMEKAGRVSVESGKYYLSQPVEIIQQLLNYEPFSHTYEKYTRKYLIPEQLFQIYYLREKSYDIATYFFRRQGDNIYFGKDTYQLIAEEHINGSVKFEVRKGDVEYVALFQKFKERPPYRGLIWKKEDIRDVDDSTLFSVVKLHNLATKKFGPLEMTLKIAHIKGEPYQFSLVIERNPILDISREAIKVAVEREGRIQEKEIPVSLGMEDRLKSVGEIINTLRSRIEERGFEGIGPEIGEELEIGR